MVEHDVTVSYSSLASGQVRVGCGDYAAWVFADRLAEGRGVSAALGHVERERPIATWAPYARRVASLIFLGLLTVIAESPVRAEADPSLSRGFDSGFASGDIDSVNPRNGNLILTIPIGGSYPLGQSLSYSLTLSYNSTVWDYKKIENIVHAAPMQSSNAGLGWLLSLGKLIRTGGRGNFNGRPTYLSPDGGEHVFYPTLHPADEADHDDPGDTPNSQSTMYTRNGSYLRLRTTPSGSEVHFPDGLRHLFNAAGELTDVRDPFGNNLHIAYSPTDPRHWTLTDSQGREHAVRFKTLTQGNNTLGFETIEVVDSIELAAFGTDVKARYDFIYGSAVIAPPEPVTNAEAVTVWLLTKLTMPDGTSFDMPVADYEVDLPANTGDRSSGALRRITLPLGGKVDWTYREYNFPSSGPDSQYRERTAGVATRTMIDRYNTTLGTWTYESQLLVGQHLVNTITDPRHTSTRRYFLPLVDDVEYGLPFTRSLPDFNGAYLSSETYDVNGARVLSKFVRYEHDSSPHTPPRLADRIALNHRVAEGVTRHDQDGGRFVASAASDFDGLGHFRQVTTRDNFGFSTVHTKRVGWNQESRHAAPNPMPGADAAWILDTFSYVDEREGQAVTSREYLFEDSTGFLKCERVLQVGTTRSPGDVLITYSYDGPADPMDDPQVEGQVRGEAWFGGDASKLGTAGCESPPAVPTYRYRRWYQAGVLRRAEARKRDDSASVLTTVHLTIDRNTGMASASTDAAGLTTSFDFDLQRRPKATSLPGAATTTSQYALTASSPNILVSVTDSTGVLLEKRSSLDGFGRPFEEEMRMPGGSSRWSGTLTRFDGAGSAFFRSVLAARPETAEGTTRSFDALGRPVSVVAADGSTVSFAYRGSRIVERTKRVWNGTKNVPVTTREEYDGLGRLRVVREPDLPDPADPERKVIPGFVTRYTYDPEGRLRTVFANAKPRAGQTSTSQTREFLYDGRGFLVSESHPESGKTSYAYDAAGEVVRKTDANGQTLWFAYDEARRLTRVSSQIGASTYLLEELEHGVDGEPGLAGRLKAAHSYNYRRDQDQTCKQFEVRQEMSYDPEHGREDSTTTKLFKGSSLVEQFSQGYSYDGAGAVTRVTYPTCASGACSVSRAVTTAYDQGRPTSVSGFASNITYHGNGLLDTLQHVNGVKFIQAADPDGMARVASVSAYNGATALWPLENYIFDRAGNIKRIGSTTYSYDSQSRLKSATRSPSSFQGYAYDAFGNLTSINSGANVTLDTNPATNRLTGARYDDAGNMTEYRLRCHSWDPLGRMASTYNIEAGTCATSSRSDEWIHVYDVAGERVWSWNAGSTRTDTFALRGLDNAILTEFTKTTPAGGSPSYAWEDYAYREGSVLGAKLSSGEIRHFDVDHLGSVRLETDSSGARKIYREFWPYGGIANTVPSPSPPDGEQMKFTGHERDLGSIASLADDFDYMHARYYDPKVGRFASVDRAGASPAVPQSWNRYSYVRNTPMSLVDPDGLQPEEPGDKWTWLSWAKLLNNARKVWALKNLGVPAATTFGMLARSARPAVVTYQAADFLYNFDEYSPTQPAPSPSGIALRGHDPQEPDEVIVTEGTAVIWSFNRLTDVWASVTTAEVVGETESGELILGPQDVTIWVYRNDELEGMFTARQAGGRMSSATRYPSSQRLLLSAHCSPNCGTK